MIEFIKSILSSDPNSMSTGRLCAILLVLSYIAGSLYMIFIDKGVPPSILVFAEATAALVIVSLFPSKVIDAINAWRTPKT
jgi:hypothetical protein